MSGETEIAELEAILNAGATSTFVDGQKGTWDLDQVRRRSGGIWPPRCGTRSGTSRRPPGRSASTPTSSRRSALQENQRPARPSEPAETGTLILTNRH